MPELGAELSKLVTLMQGLVTTPGLAAGVTEELSGFLELLKMDPDAFRQFFQTQMEAGNRFAGPLFSLLREVYQKTPGDTVRGAILNFAKRYSDFPPRVTLDAACSPCSGSFRTICPRVGGDSWLS